MPSCPALLCDEALSTRALTGAAWQAVVISIDPRRVWVKAAADADGHPLADHSSGLARGARGPAGESLCWYECTVQGGRKGSGLDVVAVSRAVEALGAGELLVNCIDCDGQVPRHIAHASRGLDDTLFLHL